MDGELSLPSEGRLAIYEPQPWPPFCSAATQKRERDREAHLNYYASAYSSGDNYHITRLKLNHHAKFHRSLTITTTISIFWPSDRSAYVSWHLQLRTIAAEYYYPHSLATSPLGLERRQ